MAELKKEFGANGSNAVKAIVLLALKELADFFNVGKNMSRSQMSLTADLIAMRFWYFKVEDIKLCFRQAMLTKKVYDRLDGNIIVGWLNEYDDERTEIAMRLSEAEETAMQGSAVETEETMNYEEYVADLERRASTDEEAASLLAQIKNPPKTRLTLMTREERDKREHDFKIWRFKYAVNKLKRK